jgi:hypothetical protein
VNPVKDVLAKLKSVACFKIIEVEGAASIERAK